MRALIDGQEIDIAPEELPAFTFSLEDTLEIGSARGSRSTTMRLPMTGRNRRIIGGHTMGERATNSLPFSVRNGTASYFDGVCFVNDRGPFDAGVSAVGNNAIWMAALRGRNWREVGMGWALGQGGGGGAAVVTDSWDGSKPYVFPLIDYGQFSEVAPGYNVTRNMLFPCMFLRNALNTAFGEVGFGIAGAGSFKRTFDRLIVPPVNGPIYGFPSNPEELFDDPGAAGFFRLNAIMPKRGVLDFLSDVCRLYSVLPITKGALVELWHYDEVFAQVPTASPIDLTNRQSGEPRKVTEYMPSALIFRMKDDKDDVMLDSLLQATGGTFEVREEIPHGDEDPQVIEVGFAPTTTITNELLLRLPMMRQRDAPGSPGTYEAVRGRTERLLIWEGTRAGSWTFEGVAQTIYPFAIGYGDGTGSEGTTMFVDKADTGVTDPGEQLGTISKHWVRRIDRWTSPRLVTDANWHDHEIAGLDIGRQVKANDGTVDGLYYVLEINQHRFGMGEPSETTLIPL